ncbi:hypothetical protein MUN81_15900 [Hymenobacter sp. 5317J-9]|uniref:hypothetical protein n=1 Tax=Hymenobacter sp. 5317J-9 TaxID=2932250 RepID=UPI001FD65400|nr:hypothetical protein [Hymenobacter sp. 5317J-9]UOQ96719.1 hypothetical protein MUN81_15900 [Hymenobacter sp. 5317J-9]
MNRQVALTLLLLLVLRAEAERLPYLSLADAAAQRTVAVSAWAQGLGPDNLLCTLTNLTDQPLGVRVPPGLHFAAGNPDLQDLLTFQEKMLVLAPHARSTVRLWGFCMEQHDHAPSGNAAYALRGAAGRDLQPLGDSLQKYPGLASYYGQMFVWSVTDHEELRDISVEPALVRGATNIMRYLSRVTGRAAGRVKSSLDHRPSVRTFTKRVFVTYHSPVSQVTSLKVFGADGCERYTVAPRWVLAPGVMRYAIGLNAIVGIDEQPSFLVRLLDQHGQVLQETQVTDATPEIDVAPTRQAFAFTFSLDKPVRNAYLRMRLPDGTLVEELKKLPFLPAGNHQYNWTFFHVRPAGTPFVARLETADGALLREQALPAVTPPPAR